MFLVRSKADELEKYTPAGKQKVIQQWLDQFGASRVYLTKVMYKVSGSGLLFMVVTLAAAVPEQVIGYDPDSIDFPNVVTEGVDELRDDIYAYLKTCQKGAVLDVLKYALVASKCLRLQ